MDFVGELTRRRLLQSAGYGVAVSSIALLATPAGAIGAVPTTVIVDELAQREGPSKPTMSIRVPAAIKDLASVPITVSIENGNFERSSVESIYILANGAPNPELARFYPLVNGPTVEMSGHVCIGESRRVWAVARLTDGSVCMAKADLPS